VNLNRIQCYMPFQSGHSLMACSVHGPPVHVESNLQATGPSPTKLAAQAPWVRFEELLKLHRVNLLEEEECMEFDDVIFSGPRPTPDRTGTCQKSTTGKKQAWMQESDEEDKAVGRCMGLFRQFRFRTPRSVRFSWRTR